jgi:hypothetical protein
MTLLAHTRVVVCQLMSVDRLFISSWLSTSYTAEGVTSRRVWAGHGTFQLRADLQPAFVRDAASLC